MGRTSKGLTYFCDSLKDTRDVSGVEHAWEMLENFTVNFGVVTGKKISKCLLVDTTGDFATGGVTDCGGTVLSDVLARDGSVTEEHGKDEIVEPVPFLTKFIKGVSSI